MTTKTDFAYRYVADSDALEQMLDTLSNVKLLAFDMECENNIHHYGTRVSLLQFSVPEHNFVVDPLAGVDLDGIRKNLIENPAVEIVLHDSDFDLRQLDREWGWRPNNLFDSMIAARIAGHQSYGVSRLLDEYFGVVHSKRYQRADWSRRPVPNDMLEYAVQDTYYLLKLRDALIARLKRNGRYKWAREEFLLCENIRHDPSSDPPFSRIKGARRLPEKTLAVLSELANEREKIARELDLPVYRVISDPFLVTMAYAAPVEARDFKKLRGLHPVCRHEGRERLIAAVRRGLANGPVKWPKRPRARQKISGGLLANLKNWRRDKSRELELDPDVVFPIQALKLLATRKNPEEILNGPPVRKWQRDTFGPEITALVAKSGKN